MTCRMPIISMVAFEDRPTRFIFVRVPNEFGRYLRTHACVAHVPCPHCNSTVGEPCRSSKNGSYHGATHFKRRQLVARKEISQIDVIDPIDGAAVTIKEAASA